MEVRISSLFLTCILIGSQSAALANGSLEVYCQNDISSDRAAIQGAVDSAPDGGTVQLRGDCQLDGTSIRVQRSNLTIKGVDGAALLGLLDINDSPVTEAPGGPLINRGIQIGGPDLVENVVIKDLKFIGHNRTVSMSSIVNLSNLCADIITSPGVRNIIVKSNNMENNVRGPQAFGAAVDFKIQDNYIVDVSDGGILLNSGIVGCFEQSLDIPVINGLCDSSGEPPPGNGAGCPVCDDVPDQICEPTGSRDIGSVFAGQVRGNIVTAAGDAPFPIPLQVAGPTSNVQVRDNTFQGGLVAVFLAGAATDVVLTKNEILDGGTQGVFDFLRFGGILVGDPFAADISSGFSIKNNRYEGNLAGETVFSANLVQRDVWLLPNTTENEVREAGSTIVTDEGTGNTER